MWETTTTYVLTRLMKCWRSTRARVERTMMVVHILPRAHRPAAKETAGSTWTIHSEPTHRGRGDLFVAPSLCLADWIRSVEGLVNPRLEQMTWCIIEAQHCFPPKLCCDVCALAVHDSDIYCIIANQKHQPSGFFFTDPACLPSFWTWTCLPLLTCCLENFNVFDSPNKFRKRWQSSGKNKIRNYLMSFITILFFFL